MMADLKARSPDSSSTWQAAEAAKRHRRVRIERWRRKKRQVLKANMVVVVAGRVRSGEWFELSHFMGSLNTKKNGFNQKNKGTWRVPAIDLNIF